ncbi:MAG: HlyD family type I secretion periplasmic adaptor subunit [Magnetococcales bacterium]|nr:HlyD family type I secretion periplasmic adaptor subunit [Magnetococcales bacterium]
MFDALQSRHLSKSVLLEETGNPVLVRAVIGFSAMILLCFLIWSSLTQVDEVSTASGEIVPTGMIKQVQHQEGGMIANILVKEGERVTADQTLILLDSYMPRSELREVLAQRALYVAQRQRLQAFLEGGQPIFDSGILKPALITDEMRLFREMIANREREQAIVQQQLDKLKSVLAELEQREITLNTQKKLIDEELKMRSTLHSGGDGSKLAVLLVQRQANDNKGELATIQEKKAQLHHDIDEAVLRLAKVSGDAREKAMLELEKVENDDRKSSELINRLEERIRLLEIRSPITGFVNNLKPHTIGGVVSRSDVLMEIIPEGWELIAEVKITPRDIGHVQPGQAVNVKLTAYDFARYGAIPGKLASISASTSLDKNGAPYYKGFVHLDRSHIGTNIHRNGLVFGSIISGMTLQADIITGRKTVLEYLLKPIYVSTSQAMRER